MVQEPLAQGATEGRNLERQRQLAVLEDRSIQDHEGTRDRHPGGAGDQNEQDGEDKPVQRPADPSHPQELEVLPVIGLVPAQQEGDDHHQGRGEIHRAHQHLRHRKRGRAQSLEDHQHIRLAREEEEHLPKTPHPAEPVHPKRVMPASGDTGRFQHRLLPEQHEQEQTSKGPV